MKNDIYPPLGSLPIDGRVLKLVRDRQGKRHPMRLGPFYHRFQSQLRARGIVLTHRQESIAARFLNELEGHPDDVAYIRARGTGVTFLFDQLERFLKQDP